jgi:hypothetical protein
MSDRNVRRNFIDLTEPPQATRPPRIMDSGNEDEDLKLAIARSLTESNARSEIIKTSGPEFLLTLNSSNDVAENLKAPSNGLLGLDRRAMEAERLARLKRKHVTSETSQHNTDLPSQKKKRSVSPPALRRPPTTSIDARSTIDATVDSATNQSIAASSNSVSLGKDTDVLYPDGVVLKTFAPAYPSEGTISFSDLIAPARSMESCLLSSFIWDYDWLFPHFNTEKTNFLLVMQGKYPSQRQQIEKDFNGIKNIKICFPPMEGQVNCMHSKLMLLFWKDRCRIVIPTANLMGFDWGVGSVMENMVFLIDLPLRESGTNELDATQFKKDLQYFLSAQTVPEAVIRKLDQYSFASTRTFGLVHTIGGGHVGEGWKETGHCGLGRVVKEMGFACEQPVEVDFVTSSVGSLNEEFLRGIYLAAQGDDGLTELTLRTSKSFPARRLGSKQEMVQRTAGRSWKDHFRFYFPSQQVIEASNGGEQSAGTICFSEKWWENAKFPKSSMRDCISARDGLLMHNKVRPCPCP